MTKKERKDLARSLIKRWGKEADACRQRSIEAGHENVMERQYYHGKADQMLGCIDDLEELLKSL